MGGCLVLVFGVASSRKVKKTELKEKSRKNLVTTIDAEKSAELRAKNG